MPAAVSTLTAQITGVALADLDTLAAENSISSGVVQASAIYSFSGDVKDYATANITAVVTLSPTNPALAAHQGQTLDMIKVLVPAFAPTGWTQS